MLLVHTRYLQQGGEEAAFAEEAAMLRAGGQEVSELVVSNEALLQMSGPGAAVTTVWSRAGQELVRDRVRDFAPEVVHFHNTFPLLSPAAYSAARCNGAAVVQTLHNYRVVCAGAMLMRDSAPCEACLGTHPWRAVAHRCYRDSAAASAAVAGMIALHRARGTWRDDVDAYICLTEFAREKFRAGGLPVDKLHVKGNTVRAAPRSRANGRKYFLYAGRLAKEKGIDFLVRAWQELPAPESLLVAGDGPLEEALRTQAGPRVQLLGRRDRAAVLDLMDDAIALIVPSVWYEQFPLVVVEALSRGLPVIATAPGALPEIVQHEETGFIVPANDAGALANAMDLLRDNDTWARMSANAEAAFRSRFAPAQNYARLLEIYQLALRQRQSVQR